MKKQIIVLIILGLVILVLGAGLGILYQMQQSQGQVNGPALLKTLSSKVVHLSASGVVTGVYGMNVTLTSNSEQSTITVNSAAKVNLFVPAANGKSAYYQAAKFSDIKVGDRLNINLGLSPDGKLQGQSVNISAAVSAPAK